MSRLCTLGVRRLDFVRRRRDQVGADAFARNCLGHNQGFVPGLEASAAWRRLDFYVEAEYVSGRSEQSSSYFDVWSELGFRPVEWLRVGVAGQRTPAYGGAREIQRCPFAQMTWRRITIGGFWFNPGSKDQVLVASIGVAF